MANYYPDLAARMKRSGDVMLHCTIAPAGVLTGCIVTAETPPDQGFGAAAIRLTSKFKYAPPRQPHAPRHPHPLRPAELGGAVAAVGLSSIQSSHPIPPPPDEIEIALVAQHLQSVAEQIKKSRLETCCGCSAKKVPL